MLSLACTVLRTRFVVYRRRFPPFLVVSSAGLVLGDGILDFGDLLIVLAVTPDAH